VRRSARPQVAEAVGYRSLDRGDWSREQAKRAKLLIRQGKTQFLGSGKATTRSKRRITPALRALDKPRTAPHGVLREESAAPLKEAEA